MKLVHYSGPHDWSALYIDGKLDTVGDHYLIHDRISTIFEVEVVNSDSFMLGGDNRKGVAKTLDAIEKFENAPYVPDPAISKAAILRQKARELLAEADELVPPK